MFRNLLRMEYRKVFFRRVFWVELILLSALAFTAIIFFYFTKNASGSNDLPKGLPAAPGLDQATYQILLGMLIPPTVAFASNILNALVIVLVGLLCAQEFAWRTLQLWLSRGVSRAQFLWAKMLILLFAVFVMLMALLLTSLVFSVVSAAILYGLPSLQGGPIILASALLSYARTFYALLPYIALTFLLAMLTRSTAAAIGISLAFLLILQQLLVQTLAALGEVGAILANYLPSSLTNALFEQESTGIAILYPGVPGAIVGIAVYAALFLLITFWQFQRQDLNG